MNPNANTNSQPNNQPVNNPNIDFQQPPNVKIIEASCKQANSSTSDFGEWTNVLKEPILIKKGSEIKAMSAFIDAPGIDSSIIQFSQAGTDLDNTHTLLSQMYISNDGFNNKTCSYDYFTENTPSTLYSGENLAVIDEANYLYYLRGEDENNQVVFLPTIIEGIAKINNDYTNPSAYSNGWTITNPGSGYSDGDIIKVVSTRSSAMDYTAKLVVGSIGQVVDFVVIDPGAVLGGSGASVPATSSDILSKTGGINFAGTLKLIEGNGIRTFGYSQGSAAGAVDKQSIEYLGVIYPAPTGAAPNPDPTLVAPGSNFKIGQVCTVLRGTRTTPINYEILANVKVNMKCVLIDTTPPTWNKNLNDPSLVPSYFDQGYNYQRCPLYRWAQTYDSTSSFAYGRNFRPSYTASDGIEYNFNTENLINKLDPSLSAQFNIGNKEDEFVPGFYHKNVENVENPGIFNFYRPSFVLPQTELTNGFQFTMGRGLDGTKYPGRGFIELNYGEDITYDFGINNIKEETQIAQHCFNQLAPGMVFNLEFEITDPDDRNDANYLILGDSFNSKYSGVYCVGEVVNEGINLKTTPAIKGTKRLQIGAPVMYDSTGQSDYGLWSYQNCNEGQGSRKTTIVRTGAPVMTPPGAPDNGVKIAVELAYSPTGNVQANLDPAMVVIININADGTLGDGDPYNENFGSQYWFKGLRVGDILKSREPNDPAIGPNQIFLPDNLTRFAVSQVDSIGGCDFSTFEQLTSNDLVFTDGAGAVVPVEMRITPLPFYMQGLQVVGTGDETILNPNFFGLQTVPNQVFFPDYPNYPPTLDNAFVTAQTATADDNITAELNCGLYKPAGIERQLSNQTILNTNIQPHDLSTRFTITKSNTVITNTGTYFFDRKVFTIGSDLTVGPYGPAIYADEANYPNIIRGSVDYIIFNLTNLANMTPALNISNLPTQGYLIINRGLNTEEHILMSGENELYTVQARSLFKVYIKSRSLRTSAFCRLSGDYNETGDTYIINSAPRLNQSFNIDLTTSLTLTWWSRGIHKENFQVEGHLNENSSGTVAVTSLQNYYNINDINLLDTTRLLSVKSWKNIINSGINSSVLESYNSGGFYYFTNALGTLSKTDHRINKFFGFAQGFSEFLLSEQFRDLADNIPDPAYNSYKARLSTDTQKYYVTSNNCNTVYGYEPVYQQKSFKIERNFAVPTDISNFWNKQSRSLQGLVDRDTGETLSEVDRTGLVQNEFMHPVYGSNSEIAPTGEYIKKKSLYPFSGGLLGGHCVGIGFPEKNQAWLDKGMCRYLPKFNGRIDEKTFISSNTQCYYIFFRNAFTTIRSYDPLAKIVVPDNKLGLYNNPLSSFIPDRTIINTLQTETINIGNCSTRAGSTTHKQIPGTINIPEKTVRLIDGTIMSFRDNDQQFELDRTTPMNKAIISELMDAIPNQTPTGQNLGSQSFFPKYSGAYPVRYLINDADGTYDRAIASQYCGSSNLTLDYSTDISSFTFQFFYSPYTSPFIDGSGGDNSTRVFYGNRPVGCYNHDCYGGIAVSNWARPNFPRGVIPYSMVHINEKTFEYPNGVNPFLSVAIIGRNFLNKLGFNDANLSIINNGTEVDVLSQNIAMNIESYQQSFTYGGGTSYNFYSLNSSFGGTNFSDLDVTDAVLTAIEAPENFAGLFAHNTVFTPAVSDGTRITQLNGDYIFYPYSISNQTSSFAQASAVRFDNCTDAFGTIGGLGLSQMGRGMGLPTTTGSTTIVDKTSIPVALNCDCNLYLSFTVDTSSNSLVASELPKKMTHGHLMLLSSLIEEPNFIMSKSGAVNGIAVISKAYITADFILSNSFLSFYAKEDRVISEITTKIVNTNFEVPTILGNNSTILYSITDFTPKSMDRPLTISEIQNNDYEIMEMLNQHLQDTSSGQVSELDALQNQLRTLGMDAIESKGDNIIRTIQNQIQAYGLEGLNSAQRREFLRTPEGAQLVQNSANVFRLSTQIKQMEQTHAQVLSGYGDQQDVDRLVRQRADITRQVRQAGERANISQNAGVFVRPETPPPAPDPLDEPEFVNQPPIPDANPLDVVRRIGARVKDPKAQFSIVSGLANLPGTNKPLVIPRSILVPTDISSVGAETGIVEPNLQPVKPDPSDSGYAPSAKQSTAAPSYKSKDEKPPSYKSEGGAEKDSTQ